MYKEQGTEEQDWLREDLRKCGFTQPDAIAVFEGYGACSVNTWLGQCHFGHPSKVRLSTPFERSARYPAKAVMWHEACHAVAYAVEGHTGHGAPWWRYVVKRPDYLIIGTLWAACSFVARSG